MSQDTRQEDGDPAGNPSEAMLRAMYISMVRIRRFEERVAELLEQGEILCPTHLYIGQEGVAVGVCAALRKDDYIFGGHRSHGHYLAKGGNMNLLMAEMFGKDTGCSRGYGGSMHLYAPDVGMMGTVPIVGATIPIAVGTALASVLEGTDRVSVAFFGDGATEEGFIYSFNGPQSLFIDIMMNVRLLFWAAANGADPQVGERAIEHARTSARYLVRCDGEGLGEEDGSVAHEAIFNTEQGRGEFRCLSTQQGYSPFTCWARGLAWALYGYAYAYGATGYGEFLETAHRCARYYLLNTPADRVPYWDYGAPGIPDEPRDSSSAAIAGCGLMLLAELDPQAEGAGGYLQAAIETGSVLSSDEYLGPKRAGEEGLLLGGVYHRPRGWGVGGAVMWGDYFFLELIERLLALDDDSLGPRGPGECPVRIGNHAG